MKLPASTVQAYIETLSSERKEAVDRLRKIMANNLPPGFKETIGYGMITYVVPHELYPAGYHCDRSKPLPFISIASQKNFISLHHMGLYANEELLNWFTGEYAKHSKTKLDMGKGCVRFKNPANIPYHLLGELAQKITPADWIEMYESAFTRRTA